MFFLTLSFPPSPLTLLFQHALPLHLSISLPGSLHHILEQQHPKGCCSNQAVGMASVSAARSLPASAAILCSSLSTTSTKRRSGVTYIEGLNSFGGLKACNNKVSSLGMPKCTAQSFAAVVANCKKKRSSGGGALSSTCNAAGEIFKIAVIMNALVLIGVAVGFVLLRVEASLEEAE